MWILVMIFCAALILLACEKWVGSCSTINQDEAESRKNSLPEQLSSKEVAFQLMPVFLGGIGLPLSIAHPLPGILCLTLALVLFLVGRKMSI